MGSEVFLVPFNDSSSTDTTPPSTSLIDSTAMGQFKWLGCGVVGTKVILAPYENDNVMTLETTVTPRTPQLLPVPAGQTGNAKWSGACVVGGKVYFVPRDNANILVFDPATNAMDLIPSMRTGTENWRGCTVVGRKMSCSLLVP